MKSAYLFLFTSLFTLVIILSGCANLSTSNALKKELKKEQFPDIELTIDPILAKDLSFGEEVELEFNLTNNRDHSVKIEYARFRLVSANLGNGKSSVTRTKKIEAELLAGASLTFTQFFYIGPDRGSQKPEDGVSQWLGEVPRGNTIIAPRKNGDILIGIVLGLKIDGKPNHDIYISKHYFDESNNTLTPYYTFGAESDGV